MARHDLLGEDGRFLPSGVYTLELLETIAERVAEGETLSAVCRDLGVQRRTVNRIRRKDPEIGALFEEAKSDGYDAIADECIAIADDGSRDYVQTDGGVMVDHDHVNRSKLRIETRLKLLRSWDPERYGDAMTIKGDKKNPLRTTHDLDDAALMQIAREAARNMAETPKRG